MFLIELIFKCPTNKFLGCLDFLFFKKEKDGGLSPLLSRVSWEKLFKNLEFDSVSGLSLSKASFTWEILCQDTVVRKRIKLSAKI